MARTDKQRAIPLWIFVAAVVLIASRIAWSMAKPEAEMIQPGPSTPRSAEVAKPEAASLVRWVPADQATAIAARSGKPIMYEFTAAWCGPCHMLEDAVFANQRLATMINQRVVPVRVVDRQQEDGRNSPGVQALQTKYEVRGFPTLVWAGADGVQKTRMEGFGGVEAFEQTMENLR